MNEKAFFKLSYGLYIVSSAANGKASGCVVNTLQQVTAIPARFSVALSKDNFTEQLIEESGVFHGVVLTRDVPMEFIGRFGFRSGKDFDKFEGMNVLEDTHHIPYLTDYACAHFTCKVIHKVDIGTHVLFVGEVLDAEIVKDEPPMTYAYYHEVKNGVTPKNAPSYQEVKKQIGWRCSVCGYIYEHEELPADFICPVCGQPASVFEKL